MDQRYEIQLGLLVDLENLIAEGYFRLRNERKKGLKCCAANEKGGQDGMKGSNPDYYWKE